ncbi:TRAP transporter large permease [Leisingera sp. S232]|uniref:TRAP transporter large permease n=1 Tax=Leisingera sp. S232 TaxID=3415132 RepID=UPI00086A0CCC|nr:hypothetical protein AB838_16375 [Rhodobacteraceae bacterium (ex Bugula neritina AB1)]
MADPILASAILFGGMFFALLAGAPIAIALGGLSVILVLVFWGANGMSMLALRAFGTTSSFEYVAIPLFIFMAGMLERSGLAEGLFGSVNYLVRRIRGGLAVGVIIICTLFAAMSGISGAATVAMGMLALPAMLSRGYSKDIALGSLAAGGSLGILIPPSVTMIVYGLVSNTSVGKLYAAGVLPGLVLAVLFIAYVLLRCRFQPGLAPTSEDIEAVEPPTLGQILGSLLPALFLMFAVLGSILLGLTSVSESAAIGAIGSILVAAAGKRLSFAVLNAVSHITLKTTCLIFWIIIGASAFSTLYTALGASGLIRDIVLGWEMNRYAVLALMMLILLIMGMFIETVGIIMITVPVFLPIAKTLGFDPVWFGILFIINMEIGFITPPFGYNLFYLKGVAPKGVTMVDIYKSVIPFVGVMLLGMALFVLLPQIILMLPNAMF